MVCLRLRRGVRVVPRFAAVLALAAIACGRSREGDGASGGSPATTTGGNSTSAGGAPGPAGASSTTSGVSGLGGLGNGAGGTSSPVAAGGTDSGGERAGGAAGAAEAGADAGTDAGSGSGGAAPTFAVVPRVLAIYGTDRLTVHGADGQVVRELGEHLALSGVEGATTVLAGERSYQTDRGGYSLHRLPRVWKEAELAPSRSSRIALSAPVAGQNSTRFRVIEVSGDGVAELDIEGRPSQTVFSRTEAFLYASQPQRSDFTRPSTIYEIASGKKLWGADISTGTFASDDGHFVTTTEDTTESFANIISLPDGAITIGQSQPAVFKYSMGVYLGVEDATPFGAVLKTYGWVTDGQPLWQMDWQGRITPFDAALPQFSEEELVAFDSDGQEAVWRRLPGSEYHALNLTTGAARPMDATEAGCIGGLPQQFRVVEDQLEQCPCGWSVDSATQCHVLATLPPIETGFSRRAYSGNGVRAVVVRADWFLNSLPDSAPDVLVFAPDGKLLAALPEGTPEIDRTGTLLLHTVRDGMKQRLGVLDLTSANPQLIWIGTALGGLLVYEQP